MVCDTPFYLGIARITHTNHASHIVYSHLYGEPPNLIFKKCKWVQLYFVIVKVHFGTLFHLLKILHFCAIEVMVLLCHLPP